MKESLIWLCVFVTLVLVASPGSVSGQAFEVLHTFHGQAFNDGAESLGLALDPNGNIFGTA